MSAQRKRKNAGVCTWNYRIVRYADGGYALHEIYYTDNKPDSWTLMPVGFSADEKEGPEVVIKALRMALADAAQRSVLQIPETWAECVDVSYGEQTARDLEHRRAARTDD